MRTPWGESDNMHVTSVPGVIFYETPSHGGFYVPSKLLGKIPKVMQAYAARWSGSFNWYEEDVAALIVVHTWPQIARDLKFSFGGASDYDDDAIREECREGLKHYIDVTTLIEQAAQPALL